jgi:hypothetical protein
MKLKQTASISKLIAQLKRTPATEEIPIRSTPAQLAGGAGTMSNPVPQRVYDKAFFTPGQLAFRWQFHPESIRRLIRKGTINAHVMGRRILIAASEIVRLENEARTLRNN